MSMILRSIVVVASFTAGTLAYAGDKAPAAAAPAKTEKVAAEKENCEVAGAKKHVKDKAACETEKGTWLEKDAPAKHTGKDKPKK